MRLFAFAVFTACFFSACSESQSAIKKQEPPVISTLTAEMIFSGDIVKNFHVASDSTAALANQLFLKAVDEFRNKKNAKGAVDIFVRSICLNPLAQSYYEMGNAAMSANELNQALNSYQMAEKLGFEPFSKLLYNYACIYSLQGKEEQAAYYLEASLQAGYSNIAQIRKDPDLENLREQSWFFENAVSEGMKGMSNPEQLFWLQFQRGFAKVEENFSIDGLSQQFKEDDQISFDFETYISEMRNAKYSREVDRLFYSVAQVPVNSDIVVLVYAEADAWSEHPFYIYRIATFDNGGKIIDKRIIAGRNNLKQLQSAAFSKDGRFTVSTFNLTYMKDIDEAGYEDNPIQSNELVTTESFHISKEGKISTEVTAMTE